MHTCVLLSYLPENKSGSFFLIKRNNLIIDIVKTVCEAIHKKVVLTRWDFGETRSLVNLGKKLVGKSLDFDNLKTLRTYIKAQVKQIPMVEFIDEIDLQNFKFFMGIPFLHNKKF